MPDQLLKYLALKSPAFTKTVFKVLNFAGRIGRPGQNIKLLYRKSGIKVESWPLTAQLRMWEIDTLSDAFTARLRVRSKKSCLSHLIVLLHDGVWMPSLCTDYNCHSRLIQCSAALRPHLLLRMSDRTAATYDQTLLSPCTRDSSLREALMCCQQCSPLSCLDLPSPSVSVKQH